MQQRVLADVLEIHNLVTSCEEFESERTEQLIKQCVNCCSVEQCVVCMAKDGVWQKGLNTTQLSVSVPAEKAWLPWKQEESNPKEASPQERGGHLRNRERER